MVFEATYLVAVLTPGYMSLCCGQNCVQSSKVLRPSNKSNGRFICFFIAAPETGLRISPYPPWRATGIFLRPAWGFYDTIKGDKFNQIDFSHD
jgi:hypothetical protein